MLSFVLVHGTGGGGWCWQKVAPLLRARGAEVYTPTLTGLGDRSHLLDCGVDLMTHVTDVVSLLFYEDLTDVILVGHSYGGMVVTGVTAKSPGRVKLLVYLDAYVPEDGEKESDLWPSDMREAIEAGMQSDPRGGRLREPPSPALLGITDPAMAEWMRVRETPHPMATYEQPVPAGSAESGAIPRVFIRCTEGPLVRIFAPFAEKAKSRGWALHEIAAGHEVMLSHPGELAELLDSIARGPIGRK